MEKKPRFIIVDDDELLLDVLKRYLALNGNECDVFSNAEDALAHFAGKPCDILITDIVMKGMKGLQLTKEVKKSWPDTNVIVMTGFIDDFSYDQAIEAGASDFIKKPFSMHEMMFRIKHVILEERLREMSNSDELTGLLNRRGFFTVAQQQLKVAARAKVDVALLFADMDKFKAINDEWGHQKGDDALVAMADIFRTTFRESDLIARISGDEFALLLIDLPESNFDIVLDRLQGNIDAYNLGSGRIFKLSLSIGMAVYDHNHQNSVEELMKQADRRMYDQKQRKRAGQV